MTTVVAPPRPAAPTSTPTGPARLAAAAAAVVALLGAFLAASGELDTLVGDTGVVVVAGTVEVGGGTQWRVAPVGRRLPTGAEIRTPDGRATLAVADGELQMAEGTRIVLGRRLAVQAGSVLVDVDDLTLVAGVVEARGRGTWRIDGGGPSRVGAYDGSVVVTDAAGRETLVRPLQELRVRDGVADGAPRPYVYTSGDPFDEELLSTAFAVDELVAALERGLTADYGTAPQSRAFYLDFDGLDGQLIAALEDVGITSADARIGPPASVLVATVMTDAVATRAGLSPLDAAVAVRDLRLDGATWGLIAEVHGLRPDDVRAAADRALALRREEVESGTGAPVFQPPAETGGDADAPSGEIADGGDTPDDDTPDGGGGTGPGDDGDSSSPDPDPDADDDGAVGELVEDVDDTVGVEELLGEDASGTLDESADLIDDLIGGVLGTDSSRSSPGDGDSSVVEEVTGTVGEAVDDTSDVVEGVGDTVGGLLGTG